MGFFSSLIGWDQGMGAINAVMASYLIEKASPAERQMIARDAVSLLMAVVRGNEGRALAMLDGADRIAQTNCIAMSCDRLSIAPPFPQLAWTSVKNPFVLGVQIKDFHIKTAVDMIRKQDGVTVVWPGNDSTFSFTKMCEDGTVLERRCA